MSYNAVTILGVPHDWFALQHLKTWVSLNLKNYFGSEKYLLAEGCVRDGLVTLGSVKLGFIEGGVSDGNGSSCAVTPQGGRVLKDQHARDVGVRIILVVGLPSDSSAILLAYDGVMCKPAHTAVQNGSCLEGYRFDPHPATRPADRHLRLHNG